MILRRKKSQTSGRRRRESAEPDARPISSSYSYRTSRSEDVDNIGRNTKKKPKIDDPRSLGRFLLQRFGLILLLIAAVVSLLNVASLQNNVKILSIGGDQTSNFLHNENDYKNEANKLMASSVLNNNKITVDANNIEKSMLKAFPELSRVTVTLPLLSKRPVIYLETSPPALILNTGQGSYLVDDDGKALLLKENAPGLADLKVPEVNDQSGLRAGVNQQVLTSDSVKFILTVVDQLKARNFTISSMTLPAAASELDVSLTGQPYSVKFNLRSNDPRQQAGTFLATIAKLQSQNVTPSQYVDVRVDGRAYYQ